MDKSKLIVIVVLFAILITFSGCFGKPRERDITESQAFAGGSQGLTVSFIAGQPPAQIFEGQPFTIAVQIDNKGEADAVDATVTLAGIDTSAQGFNLISEKTQLFSIEGVTKLDTTITPGGQHIAIFDFNGRSIFATSSFTAQAVVSYNYETRALAAACLQENAFQQTIGGTEVCKVSGVKAVQSSGAPVQVTSVEQTPSGFLIKIRNAGKGTAFVSSSGALPESDSQLTLSERDRVSITTEVAGQTLTCTPGVILLANGEGQTFCRAPDLTGRGDFVDQLQITLNYGYVDRASTTFSVQDVPV